MSTGSTGQLIGTVVGGIVGAFIPGGYVMLGAAIGGAIGGAIDPPKGPNGPRLEDKSVQLSSYGEVVPAVYGMAAVRGNIIWVENNALKETESEEGGKGGGGSVTTYKYSATFALALCLGEISYVRRIWIGSDLWHDASSATLDSQIASNTSAAQFTVYRGTADQMPDPRMQAAIGAADCPAYRGIAYIVFYDLPLEKYGNSLLGTQIKVEVVANGAVSTVSPFIGVDVLTEGTSADAIALFDDPRMVHAYVPDTSSRGTLLEYYTSIQRAVSVLDNPGGTLTPSKFSDGGTISGSAGVHSTNHLFVGSQIYHAEDGEALPPNAWMNSLARISNRGSGSYLSVSTGCLSGTVGGLLAVEGYAYSGAIIATKTGEQFHVDDDIFSTWWDTASNTWRIRLFSEFSMATVAELEAMSLAELEAAFPPVEEHFFAIGQSAASLNYGHASLRDRKVYLLTEPVGQKAILTLDLDTGGFSLLPLDVTGGTWSSWFNSPPIAYKVSRGILTVCGLASDYSLHVARFGMPIVTPSTVTLGEIVADICSRSRLSPGDYDTSDLDDTVRGFVVASTGTLRASIEALQAVWPFDAVPSGYGIKFIRRPTASVLTVPETDLAAIASGETLPPRLVESREMDSQLPRRVSVRYRDITREYDLNEQYQERLQTSAINERILDLPVVLNSSEAAGVAQTTLFRAWVERSTYTFVLPPAEAYLRLEPADVVTVQAGNATHEILLTQTNLLPDGRIECSGVRNNSATYTPNAVGVDGSAPPTSLIAASLTHGVILDIPQLHASHSATSVLCAMQPYGGTWYGGVLSLSRDSEQSWAVVAKQAPPAAVMGVSVDALGTPLTTAMVDKATSVTVIFPIGAPSSVTRDQLLNGANTFAIGAAGRWEIVGAQNCELVSGNTYVLSELLRGRFGTEWAVATHAAGDSVVLLDDTRIGSSSLPASDLDKSYHWRFLSYDQSLDTASSVVVPVTGVNMECYAPACIAGTRHPVSMDWSFSWKRRTRYNGEWRDYVNAPLNETTESYALEIWNESFTAIVREFSGVLPETLAYSLFQQQTDFGDYQSTLNVKLYQISEMRGKGYPLTATLIYTDIDPYWTNVTCALHCDGANNSTVLTDLKGNVWTHTTAGTPCKISTDAFKFGGASAYFSTLQTTYWSTPDSSNFQLNASNFTIDFWINPFTSSSSQRVLRKSNGATIDWTVGLQPANTVNFNCFNASSANQSIDSTGTVTDGQWNHVRVVRSGSTIYFFINGVAAGSGSLTNNIRNTAGASVYFGGGPNEGKGANAYVDDFRLTLGVARSTAGFTVDTKAFPNQ